MAKTKVLSLADVVLTITNDIKGIITIGGGGKQVGSVGYSYNQAPFAVKDTADGGAAATHNSSKAGVITLSIQQTSPHVGELIDFIRWARDNPYQAESSIVIRDQSGIFACTADGCFPSSFPSNQIGDSLANRDFTWDCVEINSEEEA